ncbi:hypothetical protein [Mumia sp. Pv 4-285]|uniref:DUF7927 domain-containing protein n=1 Tax=Mumia qirimensis TaxID=3234852 RepID=UPI00351D50D3
MVGGSPSGRWRRFAAVLGAVALTAGLSAVAAPAPAVLPDLVVPQAVPPATGNNAVITVKVGGSRTGSSGVSSLSGVQLGFYDNATGGTPAFTCTSDADGDCSIVVPDTQAIGGSNRNRRFWVRQVAAPTGWYTNPSLGTGETVASDPYRFQTGTTLQNGQTYSSTVNFMIGTGNTNNEASGGVWQNSLANPVFPAQCGVNVAIVHDLSNSVTDAQLVGLKAASAAFVDSLTGTPSAVSSFTFASSAPAAGAANATFPLTSVATPGGATAVKASIAGITKPGGAGGGTNWDRGFAQVAESTTEFDVAVIITDGNPTYYGQNVEGPGSRTRFREVENGIFSANAIKAKNTRVIAFGVGDGVSNTGSGLNLRSISGPNLGSDYYQTANYVEAGQQLRALALGSCLGSVSVVKQIVPPTAPPGSTAGAVAAPGWEFAAETFSSSVIVTPPASRTTGATGAVNFPLEFTGGVTSGTVGFAETQQAGFTLQQVNGNNATCTRTDTGAAVPSTNSGALGFLVTANSAFPITCTVYNRAPDPPATVTVNKTWVINGTAFADGTQPEGLVANGTLNGTTVPWGAAQVGFFLNDEVAIGETVDLTTRTGCTLVSQQLTSRNGATVSIDLPAEETLTAAVNTYTITNVLTCVSTLTLAKEVRGAVADPTLWTLTSIAPAGALTGPAGASGSAGVTSVDVTPGVRYGLTESGGDLNFIQFVDSNAVIPPGNSGSWTCQQVGPDGEVIPGYGDGLNGGVNVPVGYDVRCTTFNDGARLALSKLVVNAYGGSAVPSDWSLTATPLNGPAGLEPVTVTGSAVLVPFNIRPGVIYRITESGGPAGYAPIGPPTCQIAQGEPRDVDTVTVPPLFIGSCTFTNREQPAFLTLVKEVTNDNGGTAEPGDWTLSADGMSPISGVSGSPEVTDAQIAPGQYLLAESGGPGGYTAGDWECEGGDLAGSVVTVPSGGNVTCTIVNDDEPGSLTLVKTVTNDDGGTAEATEWTLSAVGPTTGITGPTGSPTVTNVTVSAGSYALAETGPGGYTASVWSCVGPDGALPVVAGVVSVANGADVTCTVVNDDDPGTLTLVKEVVNDNGGTAEATEWTLSADGPTTGIEGPTGDGAVTAVTVSAGDYVLSEADGPVGYTASDWDCGEAELEDATVTVPNGGAVTCTITNDDQPGELTLVKTVTNDNGGTALPTAWTLGAAGPTPITGTTGSDAVTGATVDAGDYTLSESGGPDGYTAGEWDCGDATIEDGVVTVPNGADVTCTINNDDQPGTLTLVKEVVNDNGGTAEATEWTLSAEGPTTGIEGPTGDDAVTAVDVTAGEYSLLEDDGPDGYTATDWDCEDAELEGATVTVPNGGAVTCTITNNDQPGELTLVKTVTNDNGGTAEATDWTLAADGPTEGVEGSLGDPEVTNAAVSAGDYTLSESGGPDGYAAGDWDCGAATVVDGVVTVPLDTAVTCTINNDDEPGTLTLVKEVVNDDGGSAEPTDWTLTADGPTDGVEGVTGDPAVTDATVDAGSYDLSESDGPLLYAAGDWTCEGGSVTGASVVVPNGGDVTCTIVNTHTASRLTLVKVVVNDDGGTAVATDWTLSADGPTPVSGATGDDAVTTVFVGAGDYALSETGPDGYTASDWVCTNRGDPITLDGATVTLAARDDVTCTITNDDDATPPASTWTVVKSSDPPSGSKVDPGDVVTYTVRAGVVSGTSVDGVTVVDDLSNVLVHASLVGGSITASAGSTALSGSSLTWNIGTLTGTQTLTYKVTVAGDAEDVVLRNVVTGDGAQPCPPEGPDLSSSRAAAQEDCRTTTHETPPRATPTTPDGPGLPDAGGPAGWISVAALLMMLTGGWLLAWRRRRGARLVDQN